MKRVVLSIITVSMCILINAQNFLITFAGTGASLAVNTVKVENLTQGTSLILIGSDNLRLTVVTGIFPIESNQSTKLKIYPNPMTDNSILQIFPPIAGNADIRVFDMTGKMLRQFQCYLDHSLQEFRFSGLNNGFYLINVVGNNYQYSEKLLSNMKTSGTITLEKISNNQAVAEKRSKIDYKGPPANIDMAYVSGDRLKFTGISGNFSTVIIDIPEGDKTITFNFISCTDGDSNSYPVVGIGTQVWMEDNLKTSKYNDGTSPISNVTEDALWLALNTPAYCWYSNNEATHKATYGALYNWYIVNTESNGGKNVCPTGWHVPTETEWTTLSDYLLNNGYDFAANGRDIAKSMAATSGWITFSSSGTIGNDQASNNSSGFTALPGGFRHWETGIYHGIGNDGNWWSATGVNDSDATNVGLSYGNGALGKVFQSKKNGFSIRCLKDN